MASEQSWCGVLDRGDDNDVVQRPLGVVGAGDEVGGKGRRSEKCGVDWT